ncbi:response regulator transcription factor [Streptomyces sp. NEAU-W12]|uniref:response regulator transcription factor n=1 Tax=Streptomyces sp. NEAU-W12 TaxID=2994668 RepID=UPI00224AB7D0|nr:LuxR C-terminal-related transcriptional regulator [Streptomyces sp. NEAU-W12]MCX2925916.1 LuxR C-terminal-related transcriptional regulator [Streptomyces sp. NEAU-W12]
MTATLTAAPAPAAPMASAAAAGVLPTLRIPPSRGADRVRATARRAGLAHAAEHGGPGAVTVVAAADAAQALRGRHGAGPLVLVCDTVGRTGLRLALRAGAVVLRAADLTGESLAAAVRRAAHPHPSIPYPDLSHLLAGGPGPGDPADDGGRPVLTARQTSVLRLMAEGHGNADIALLLRCSEHTVKNVIYEIMARLQARNRAHAVAHAVRHGLV